MSDDLVKRLRDRRVCSIAQNSCRNDFICEQAADRIEELEAENAELKAKLVWAVEALRFLKSEIRGHGFSDEGRMLAKCNSTLEQLTGGKDE